MSALIIKGNTSGAGSLTLQSANTSSTTTLTLPATDGSPNQAITTDGSGNLTFSTLGYINAPQSTNTTLALTDQGKHVYFTGGSTATLSVPTNASVAFPTGTTILVVNNNSGNLTIQNATSGVTFQLANGATGNRTVATKGMATLLYVGSDTWYVSGAGVT